MSQKNENFNFYIYVPLVLTFTFLLGCLAVALVNVRENTDKLTMTNVSEFDIVSQQNSQYQTDIKQDGGIKYRLVSAPESTEPVSSEFSIEMLDSVPVISAEPVFSEEPVSSQAPVSSEETVSEEPVSSEEPVKKIVLPDVYMNFIPPKEGHIAYLTFDDGPSENTEEILDILDYYHVKATFFVVYHKDMADKYREIVKRGHTIALHSYSHDYKKIYSSETAYFNDLNKISSYIKSVTGVNSKILRFPGGSSNTVSNYYCKDIMQTLRKSVVDKGYSYHDWNVDSGDASGNNIPPETLLANVKASLTKYRKPDILMHDTGDSKETTVEALGSIIEYIHSQGYSIERLELNSYPVRHSW